MDATEKSLGDELAREASKLNKFGTPPQVHAVNGGQKTVRLAEQIDRLIADFELRIEMLQKIKESL